MSDQIKRCIKCDRAAEKGALFCPHHRPPIVIHTRARVNDYGRYDINSQKTKGIRGGAIDEHTRKFIQELISGDARDKEEAKRIIEELINSDMGSEITIKSLLDKI